MRIALLTDGIHPYVIGGMQRHSFYLAKYFAKNGVQIDLYHFNQSSYDISKIEFFSEEEKKNIRSIVLKFPDFGKLPGHYIRESYEYSMRVYKEFIKNTDVDFIYAKGFSGWKLLEEKKKGLKCAPIGVKFHGMNMFQKPASFKGWLEQLMLRSAVKFNLSHADYVFSYGGKITDIIRRAGVPDSKIIEAPTGIEESWLVEKPANNHVIRKFIYIGRYEQLKGIEELSHAIKSLIKKENFEFHFIGPIPEKVKIKNQKIIYHGQMTDEKQMQEIMDSCDVLVLPSYSEGMPNVILEAMARGLSIIATDVGAVNMLVNKNNGWLIPFSSVKNIELTLIDAIKISEQDLHFKKQESLKKIRETFLWEDIALLLIDRIKIAIS